MKVLVERANTSHTPESLADLVSDLPGTVLLRSAPGFQDLGRYSFVTRQPFLTFRSWESRCESIVHTPGNLHSPTQTTKQFGNPWAVLDSLMARYELAEDPASPFPLGGCFGWWGYDLRTALEPRLRSRPPNDLELPDCTLGFYASLVAFDHRLGETWVISTGLHPDGSRNPDTARRDADRWHEALNSAPPPAPRPPRSAFRTPHSALSCMSQDAFLAAVRRAREYIRAGDIYQVNLAHRLTAGYQRTAWDLFQSLQRVSPAPFAAFLNSGDLQLISSSPELFLRLSGDTILTRPIKGTRPRSADPALDAQLAHELQSSPKEAAELVMITDLLRNDLGRVCTYGSIHVQELMRLEKFAQVQHLVSTVIGRLRKDVTHFGALAACFPGGSITGAPKIRAMEIIDALEPVSRGPYTGAIGYLGFNRQSQLSIAIRTALLQNHHAHFHTGAGIVADSDPAAEYDETLAKAKGFLEVVAAEPPNR